MVSRPLCMFCSCMHMCLFYFLKNIEKRRPPSGGNTSPGETQGIALQRGRGDRTPNHAYYFSFMFFVLHVSMTTCLPVVASARGRICQKASARGRLGPWTQTCSSVISYVFTPRELVNPLCRSPCCTKHQPKENHMAETNRGRALPFISNTSCTCVCACVC